MILGLFSALLLTIDSCRRKELVFDGIKNKMAFFRYRNMNNEESMAGDALYSRQGDENNDKAIKSEVDEQEKDSIFRKINWIPNINKFGHLNNVLEEEEPDKEETKSMPGENKFQKLSRLTPPIDPKEDVIFAVDKEDPLDN